MCYLCFWAAVSALWAFLPSRLSSFYFILLFYMLLILSVSTNKIYKRRRHRARPDIKRVNCCLAARGWANAMMISRRPFDELFRRVTSNSNHVLHPYLPGETEWHIPYQLRTHAPCMILINKTKFLNDADFIIRLLYKHSYCTSVCTMITMTSTSRTSHCNHCTMFSISLCT